MDQIRQQFGNMGSFIGFHKAEGAIPISDYDLNYNLLKDLWKQYEGFTSIDKGSKYLNSMGKNDGIKVRQSVQCL